MIWGRPEWGSRPGGGYPRRALGRRLSRSLSFWIPLPPASGTHCPGWNHDTGLMTRGRPVAYDVTRSPGQALGACDSFGLEGFMKELLKGVDIILGVLTLLVTVANAGLTSRFIAPSHM